MTLIRLSSLRKFFISKSQKKVKKEYFVHSIKTSNPLEDLGLSLADLQAIAQVRGIKDYENISRDELLSVIAPSKKAKKSKKR